MTTKVAILGTRYPDFDLEQEVLDPLGVEIISGSGADEAAVLAESAGASVVIAGSRPRFTAAVLEQMDASAVIRAGIGVDSVDLDAARRLGVWVLNVPDYGTDAVALHTLTIILAALRRLTEADRIVRSGGWGFEGLRPMRLPASLTAGVVGYGRIGRAVADHLGAVGFAEVLIADPYVDLPTVGLTELLSRSDVVALHAPGPSDGSPLLGPAELAVMREGSVLVNTARGSLIDPQALADALAARRPLVAALDVFSPEPPDLGVFAEVQDRLILSPHTAWYTEESQSDLRIKSAWEARRILQGEEPLNVIVRPEEPS